MSAELRGMYRRPIMSREDRAFLQRERDALVALAAGCRVFRRIGDPDGVVREKSGALFERYGTLRFAVRGVRADGSEDTGLRCPDCPLGDLLPAGTAAGTEPPDAA